MCRDDLIHKISNVCEFFAIKIQNFGQLLTIIEC